MAGAGAAATGAALALITISGPPATRATLSRIAVTVPVAAEARIRRCRLTGDRSWPTSSQAHPATTIASSTVHSPSPKPNGSTVMRRRPDDVPDRPGDDVHGHHAGVEYHAGSTAAAGRA